MEKIKENSKNKNNKLESIPKKLKYIEIICVKVELKCKKKKISSEYLGKIKDDE